MGDHTHTVWTIKSVISLHYQAFYGSTKDILIIGLLLNDSMICKPKKTLYQS